MVGRFEMQGVQDAEEAERERSLNAVFLSRTLKSVANKAAASENLRRTSSWYVARFDRRENEVDDRFQRPIVSR